MRRFGNRPRFGHLVILAALVAVAALLAGCANETVPVSNTVAAQPPAPAPTAANATTPSPVESEKELTQATDAPEQSSPPVTKRISKGDLQIEAGTSVRGVRKTKSKSGEAIYQLETAPGAVELQPEKSPPGSHP